MKKIILSLVGVVVATTGSWAQEDLANFKLNLSLTNDQGVTMNFGNNTNPWEPDDLGSWEGYQMYLMKTLPPKQGYDYADSIFMRISKDNSPSILDNLQGAVQLDYTERTGDVGEGYKIHRIYYHPSFDQDGNPDFDQLEFVSYFIDDVLQPKPATFPSSLNLGNYLGSQADADVLQNYLGNNIWATPPTFGGGLGGLVGSSLYPQVIQTTDGLILQGGEYYVLP